MAEAIIVQVEVMHDGQMRFDIPKEFAGTKDFWLNINGEPIEETTGYDHEGTTVKLLSTHHAAKKTDKVYFTNR